MFSGRGHGISLRFGWFGENLIEPHTNSPKWGSLVNQIALNNQVDKNKLIWFDLIF